MSANAELSPTACEIDVIAACRILASGQWPLADLVALLQRLPDEDEYHPDHSARLIGRHFPDALPAFLALVGDESLDRSLRHRALIGAGTIYHNQFEYSKLRHLIRQYRPQLQEYFRWRLLATLPVLLESKDEFQSAIQQLQDLAARLPADPGVSAHYAELVATACERFAAYRGRDEVLARALTLVNRSMLIEEYPKYYFIRGRLHLILAEYDEARDDFLAAIDREDMTRGDYALRLQRYHQYLTLLDMSRSIAQTKENFAAELASAIARQDEQSRSRQLEFIGFFVAIMSFVITGFGLAQRYPVDAAAQLLFVTASCLVAAVAGFSILSRSGPLKERLKSTTASLALSALLLSVAALLVPRIFPGTAPSGAQDTEAKVTTK